MTWPFGALTPLRYAVILVDPPWRFQLRSPKGMGRSPDGRPDNRSGHPERHYPTMSMDELRALPVNQLAAPDSILLMWAVDSMLPQAIALGAHYGFKYQTVGFYWAKERRVTSRRGREDNLAAHRQFPMGMGYWTRGNPEVCLLFTTGRPARRSAGVRKLIVAPRREHSRKPDELHKLIEQLCDGPRAELFAREPRDGWDVWGNETAKFERIAA